MVEQWLPTIVSVGALGLVFWGIRSQRSEMIKSNDNLEDKVEKNYLTKELHDKLDEIQYLKLKEVISDEITKLNDVIFPELRGIKDRLPPNTKNKE